ncbi:MAG: histone deacetylase family protein [Lysobacteraceae bacterium]
MLIYSHPACLRHDPGTGHAESPNRLHAVIDALRALPSTRLEWREAPAATRAQLSLAHDTALIKAVLDEPRSFPHRLDADTALSEGSAEAALRAAGAVVAAVDAICDEHPDTRARQAFCAVRPPGHHATADTAMGFCLFNAMAVGARHAIRSHGFSRVAIVDFDVHHGNGTQAIFEHDPAVLYLSSHQLPLYPDSGHANERGVGNVFNAPLPAGANGDAFRHAWRDVLLPALERFQPQLILASAGFDGHWLDPLAGLLLKEADYAWIGRELLAAAEEHCGGRLISMLEGGYSLSALGASAAAYVSAQLQD